MAPTKKVAVTRKPRTAAAKAAKRSFPVDNWPFEDHPNVSVVVDREIAEGGPILLVSREKGEGGWMFLRGGKGSGSSVYTVVSLGSMIRRDPSVAELSKLRRGWQAVRKRVGGPWKRSKLPTD